MKLLGKAQRDTILAYAIVTACIAYAFSAGSCANTSTPPSGGPKDTIPPVIVEMFPDSNALNVPYHKTKLEFTFDEYVVLKDPNSNVLLSPPQSKKPTLKIKGKSVVVTFDHDLDSLRTYNLSLGNAIADNNEGNLFTYFTFPFSTGSYLDSMYCTGSVLNAETLYPEPGVTVAFYKQRPDFFRMKIDSVRKRLDTVRRMNARFLDSMGMAGHLYDNITYADSTVFYTLYAISDSVGTNVKSLRHMLDSMKISYGFAPEKKEAGLPQDTSAMPDTAGPATALNGTDSLAQASGPETQGGTASDAEASLQAQQEPDSAAAAIAADSLLLPDMPETEGIVASADSMKSIIENLRGILHPEKPAAAAIPADSSAAADSICGTQAGAAAANANSVSDQEGTTANDGRSGGPDTAPAKAETEQLIEQADSAILSHPNPGISADDLENESADTPFWNAQDYAGEEQADSPEMQRERLVHTIDSLKLVPDSLLSKTDSIFLHRIDSIRQSADSIAGMIRGMKKRITDFENGNDSLVYNYLPDAVAMSDQWGYFVVRNIEPVPYMVYAFKDDNYNSKYDPYIETIAFLDTLFTPDKIMAPGITELGYFDMKDTLGCLARPYQLELVTFMEISPTQYIRDFKRDGVRSMYVKFAAPNAAIDTMWFEGRDSTDIITQFNAMQDSLSIWINDPEEIQDTLYMGIKYLATDSLNNLSPTYDTLRYVIPKELRKDDTKKFEKKDENAKREDLLEFEFVAEEDKVEQYGIQLKFKSPLVSFHTDSISFTYVTPREQEGTMEYTFEQDSSTILNYIIRPKDAFLPGYEYTITCKQATFKDINGFTNDSTAKKFSLPNDDKLSNLTVNLSNVESIYIIDLVNEKRDKTLRSFKINTDTTLLFPYIKAGKYSIRITEDLNSNGLFDTGSLLDRRQPEKVIFYKLADGNDLIDIPEQMDLEQDIDIAVLTGKAAAPGKAPADSLSAKDSAMATDSIAAAGAIAGNGTAATHGPDGASSGVTEAYARASGTHDRHPAGNGNPQQAGQQFACIMNEQNLQTHRKKTVLHA